MIYQTINNASQFRDQFHRCGRGDQFSYEALGLIFDYLNDSGSDVELDVIAICCEFAEDTWEDVAKNYGIDLEGIDSYNDEAAAMEAVRDYLEKNTSVVGEVNGGFVYVQF